MFRILSAVAGLVLLCFSALGQISTSRIIGNVLDSSGAAVAGAKVSATNEKTNFTVRTEASAQGVYVFEAMTVGTYTITVESAGFKKFTTKGNELTIGVPMTVNANLEVGATTETVEVAERAELVQTSTSGNIGNRLSQKVIQDLPIVGTRGRNPLDLVLTQPGVVSGSNTGGGIIVNGARDRAWNFTVDGIDSNETSAGGSNFSPVRMNPDALAEFRVVTSNPSADMGRNSGANVAMVTRSGSNDLHGTGFWFYRTPRLNANEWENNSPVLAAGASPITRRQFVQNIFGGSIGGPVYIPKVYDGHNKTFFFLNIQRLAATETRFVNRSVYTASARAGNWRYITDGRQMGAFGTTTAVVDANGNLLPNLNAATYNLQQRDPRGIGLDRTIASAIAKTPLPNNYNVGDGLNVAGYSWTPQQLERQQDNTLRFDHYFTDKMSIFGRFSWGFQNTNCDNANGGLQLFPGQDCIVNTKRDPQNFAINHRWNPTSKLTNEFVFGRNYFGFDFVIPVADINRVAIAAPVTLLESNLGAGNARFLNTWQIVDNASYVSGNHTFKFGLNFRLASHRDVRNSIAGENAGQNVNFSTTINPLDATRFGLPAGGTAAGQLNPNSLATMQTNLNFLMGRVGRSSRGFASDGQAYVVGAYDFKARFREYDFYVADTWRIRKNLTVDYGLRWEAKLSPTEANNRILRPNTPLVFGAPSTSTAAWTEGQLYRNDWNNWAPSLGIAYDPFGKGKTVIRSNYRMAYDRINTFILSSSIFQNLPGITIAVEDTTFGASSDGRLSQLSALNPPTVSPATRRQPAAFSNNTITVMDPNFETPTTHMWSLGIQQELPARFVFSADYIGRRAHNLIGAYNANQVDIWRSGFLDGFNAVRSGGTSALMDRITSADGRRTATESSLQFLNRLFPTQMQQGSVANIANALASRVGNAAFFRRFPQFGALNVVDSNDFSTYNALQMQIERRMFNGLQYQFSYTWAKALDVRSFDPAFTVAATGAAQSAASTPFDIANRKLNYARADSDFRHAFQSFWVYSVPVGRNQKLFGNMNRVLDAAIGGWQVAGTFRRLSGRPYTIFSGVNTFGDVVSSTANCNGCDPSMGNVFDQTGFRYYLNAQERAKFSLPAAGLQGNTPRNFFDQAWRTNLDFSMSKRFKYWGDNQDRILEFRADVINATNTPVWGVPTATVTSAALGQFGNPISESRKMQLGIKMSF
jgi:hypothetical protein